MTVLAVPFIGGRSEPEEVAAAANCPGATYTVVSGDSWYKIANKFGVTMAALTAANNATTSTMIHPGNVLCLPSGSSTPTTTAGSTTTTTPVAGGKVSIKQFPVQGTCQFIDSYGAARSGGRSHEGVDIIAPTGRYVYAVEDGTLTKQYLNATGSLSGNGWRLTRADGTYFFYAHLSTFAAGLKVGSTVKAGQILGQVGMTGNAGTPHLHFEVHPSGGASVNPTAIVKAVDGCKITTVPAQPGGAVTPTTTPATTVPPTTTKPTTPPTTTPPTTTTVKPTTPPAPTAPVTPGGLWQFTAPVKAFDTGGAKLAPGTIKKIKVAGLTDVPASTTGVMVRIAARNITAPGFMTVFPCDAGVPGTSTLNYQPGRLAATMTMVKVVNGEICVQVSAAVDARFDVVAVLAAQGVGPQPMVTKRAFDTRTTTAIPTNGTRAASISSMGVPAGSKAVTIAVTVISPAVAGSIGVGPCGGTPWILPFHAGANQVFSGVFRSNDAGLCVSVTQQAHVIVDVTAVWTGAKPLLPVAPQRLLDTRSTAPITPAGKFVPIAVPNGATQAQLNVALIGGTTSSSLFIWNCADKVPGATAVHTPSRTTTSATVTLNVTGKALCLSSTANVQLVIDLVAAG